MTTRWLLAAFLAAAAAGSVAALTHDWSSAPKPSPISGPQDATHRIARETRPGGFLPDGAADVIGGLGAVATREPEEPGEAGEADGGLEAELRRTDDAIRASRRVSDPGEPAPRPAARTAHPPMVATCSSAGLACRSSVECCPGLACTGGVAGYGTSGRCEG